MSWLQDVFSGSTSTQGTSNTTSQRGPVQMPGLDQMLATYEQAYYGLPGSTAISPYLPQAAGQQAAFSGANAISNLGVPTAFNMAQGYSPNAVQAYASPTMDAQLAEMSKWKNFSKAQTMGDTAGQIAKLGALTGSQGRGALDNASAKFENAWAPAVGGVIGQGYNTGVNALGLNTQEQTAGLNYLPGAQGAQTQSNMSLASIAQMMQQGGGYTAEMLGRLNPSSWFPGFGQTNTTQGTTTGSTTYTPSIGSVIGGLLGFGSSMFGGGGGNTGGSGGSTGGSARGGSIGMKFGGSVSGYANGGPVRPFHEDMHFTDKVAHAFDAFHRMRKHAATGGKMEPFNPHSEPEPHFEDGGFVQDNVPVLPRGEAGPGEQGPLPSGVIQYNPEGVLSHLSPFTSPGGAAPDFRFRGSDVERTAGPDAASWARGTTVSPMGLGGPPPGAPPAPSAAPEGGETFLGKLNKMLGNPFGGMKFDPRFDPNSRSNVMAHGLMNIGSGIPGLPGPFQGYSSTVQDAYWKNKANEMRVAELTGQLPGGQQTLAGAKNPAEVKALESQSEEAKIRIAQDELRNKMRLELQMQMIKRAQEIEDMRAWGVIDDATAEMMKRNLALLNMQPSGELEFDPRTGSFKPRGR